MLSIYSSKDHRWRDAYNPLRGLSLPKLVSLLESGERGQYADLQWFYHYMERSDAMIYSVLQRRRAALLAVDWDVREVSDADSGLAAEQAAFLTEVYDRIDNFRDAVSFLFTGFFRGYAHVEKHFSASGLIHRLEPVEQWFWVRDGMFGEWEYNENAVSGRARGIGIEPENFVILEGVPLNRILAVLYLRKNLSDRQITLTATGGLLTMLSESGTGTLAGGAHSDTFSQIARGDAVRLSGVLQRDIDVPLLNAFFPGQPVQAYFEFSLGVSEVSERVVEDAVRLAGAGYRMDAQELSEKTGYGISEQSSVSSDQSTEDVGGV